MVSTLMRNALRSTGASLGIAAVLILGTAAAAPAATVIDGPVDLGTAATYGVLGSSTVTNTGPTVVNGDLGLSPGSSITGFGGAPDGLVNGTIHQTDAEAALARSNATTAYGVAASLSPTRTGVGELAGLSLTPGVYSGGELALSGNGILTLAGSADSVWVFQASSTLTVGGASQIVITGGASSCNVFWQVGSSATIGTAADFSGTVLADQAVTVTTGATVEGRLIALNAAVTLDTNTVTAPSECGPAGTPYETVAPSITSDEPTDGIVGSAYSFTVTADGTPAPVFTVTGGLPDGLSMDGSTGVISGTPSAAGITTITVNAANGTAPDDSATYTISVAAPIESTPAPEEPTPVAAEPTTTPSTGGDGGGNTGGDISTQADGGTGVTELARTGAGGTAVAALAAVLLLGGAVLMMAARGRARRLSRIDARGAHE